MKKQLAFVLGGGGARGALQVGALRALLEAGLRPDILVGTSIGAANATFLALHGINLDSLDKLTECWQQAEKAELLPSNYLWLTVRALFHRPSEYPAHRMRNFFISNGLNPEMRFKDIEGVRLYLVAADLNSCRPVLYGQDPEESVLEAVLASTTLPPWVSPIEKEGKTLIDGGVVSTLSIQSAMQVGATEIIALDLSDSRVYVQEGSGFGPFLGKLIHTVEQRQTDLELELAAARRVPVLHIPLKGANPVQLWDFNHSLDLMDQGCAITKEALARWQKEHPPKRRSWFSWGRDR